MALTNKLTDIADAIREKTDTTESMTLAEMPSKIRNIQTGSNVEITETANEYGGITISISTGGER